jgi:hypothetical protein
MGTCIVIITIIPIVEIFMTNCGIIWYLMIVEFWWQNHLLQNESNNFISHQTDERAKYPLCLRHDQPVVLSVRRLVNYSNSNKQIVIDEDNTWIFVISHGKHFQFLAILSLFKHCWMNENCQNVTTGIVSNRIASRIWDNTIWHDLILSQNDELSIVKHTFSLIITGCLRRHRGMSHHLWYEIFKTFWAHLSPHLTEVTRSKDGQSRESKLSLTA